MADNLGGKVTTQTTGILDIVQRMWGAEYSAPDHGMYTMSNNRKFDSTDKGRTGIYGVEVTEGLLIDSLASERYPDMYPGVVETADDSKIVKD